jgi:hypothetical protein
MLIGVLPFDSLSPKSTRQCGALTQSEAIASAWFVVIDVLIGNVGFAIFVSPSCKDPTEIPLSSSSNAEYVTSSCEYHRLQVLQ